MRLCILVVVVALTGSTLLARAQSGPAAPQPYARINRATINYFGPGREATADIGGPEIKIGVLVPLQGPQKEEGRTLVQAAQMALEDAPPNPLPGHRVILAVRDATGPWGRASGEIVKLVFDDDAVALVTGADGSVAHLAEQVGNRDGVPTLTLASDNSTTETNIPWLFRVSPSDADQARAFAQNIYSERRLHRVLLVSSRDHDGRVGSQAFQEAARRLAVPSPDQMEISTSAGDAESIAARIKATAPEAIVLWTESETAAQVLARIPPRLNNTPVYLCRKAASGSIRPAGETSKGEGKTESSLHGGLWVAALSDDVDPQLRKAFDRRYVARTGALPSREAYELYDAVGLVIQAVREVGPNRARVRDWLAGTSNFQGLSGIISFDGAGNNRAAVALVRLP